MRKQELKAIRMKLQVQSPEKEKKCDMNSYDKITKIRNTPFIYQNFNFFPFLKCGKKFKKFMWILKNQSINVKLKKYRLPDYSLDNYSKIN